MFDRVVDNLLQHLLGTVESRHGIIRYARTSTGRFDAFVHDTFHDDDGLRRVVLQGQFRITSSRHHPTERRFESEGFGIVGLEVVNAMLAVQHSAAKRVLFGIIHTGDTIPSSEKYRGETRVSEVMIRLA